MCIGFTNEEDPIEVRYVIKDGPEEDLAFIGKPIYNQQNIDNQVDDSNKKRFATLEDVSLLVNCKHTFYY